MTILAFLKAAGLPTGAQQINMSWKVNVLVLPQVQCLQMASVCRMCQMKHTGKSWHSVKRLKVALLNILITATHSIVVLDILTEAL